jgi:hypothetical protein
MIMRAVQPPPRGGHGTNYAAHLSHVVDESGVTPVLFRTRVTDSGTKWSNAEPFSLPPGGVLCFGPGFQPVTNLVVFPHETLTLELLI